MCLQVQAPLPDHEINEDSNLSKLKQGQSVAAIKAGAI